jgi:hypothetical protein
MMTIRGKECERTGRSKGGGGEKGMILRGKEDRSMLHMYMHMYIHICVYLCLYEDCK